MGVVINPIGWRLNILKYWNLYTWSDFHNYSFLTHRLNNFIVILKFYLKKKIENLLLSENKTRFNIRFVNFRILQFSNKFILLIFFENYSFLKEIKANEKTRNNKPTKKLVKNTLLEGSSIFGGFGALKKIKRLRKIRRRNLRNIFFKTRFPFFKKEKKSIFRSFEFNKFIAKKIRFYSGKQYLPYDYYSFLSSKGLRKYNETLQEKRINFFLNLHIEDGIDSELYLLKKKMNYRAYGFFKLFLISNSANIFFKKRLYLRNFKKGVNLGRKIKKFSFFRIKNSSLKKKVDYIFYFFPFFIFLKRQILIKFKRYINFSTKMLDLNVFFLQTNYSDFNINYMIEWFLKKIFGKRAKFKRTLSVLLRTLFYLTEWGFIRGYQVQIVGRISKKDRALYIWKRHLNVSLTSKLKKINYYEEIFITKFSTCSLKIWVEKF